MWRSMDATSRVWKESICFFNSHCGIKWPKIPSWKSIEKINMEEKEIMAQTLLLAASSACLTKAVTSAVTCCITEQ